MSTTSIPKAYPLTVHIRWMIRRDLPLVLSIERESFEFPWTEGEFINTLRQRNCIGMVAELDGELVAFMVYLLEPRAIHLLSMAVASGFRRRAIGLQLMGKLRSKLAAQRRNSIVTLTRETNLPSQLFLRDNGFKATSVVRGHWADTDEDAYVFRYSVVAESPVENRLAVYFQGGA